MNLFVFLSDISNPALPITPYDHPSFIIFIQVSQEDTDNLLESMRQQIKGRGSTSFQSLSRLFRIMDNDKKLSYGEFKKGVHDIGLTMNEEQVRAMFNSFDNVSQVISHNAE